MQYEVMYPLQRAADERPVAPGEVLDLSREDAAELVESGILREVPGQKGQQGQEGEAATNEAASTQIQEVQDDAPDDSEATRTPKGRK